MKAALDTNVLVYAEGLSGSEREWKARELVRKLPEDVAVIPVQALGELYRVLVGKAGWSRVKARTAICGWRDMFPLVDTSEEVILDAVDLATAEQLYIWDAVILAAASKGGCRLLLSEDFSEGFTWRGVTVTNPFGDKKQTLLEALLRDNEDSQ